MRLKRPSGWFAAGREVDQAIKLLSDGAFKVYVYLCLHAKRETGRLSMSTDDVARILKHSPATIREHIDELNRRGVCRKLPANEIEICDDFWPYAKPNAENPERLQAAYLDQIRGLLAARRCIQISFSAADKAMARDLFGQGVPVELIARAVLLGCARKYISLLNGQVGGPIASLHYFRAIIDEVVELPSTPDYWHHLAVRVASMEVQWSNTQKRDIRPAPSQTSETK